MFFRKPKVEVEVKVNCDKCDENDVKIELCPTVKEYRMFKGLDGISLYKKNLFVNTIDKRIDGTFYINVDYEYSQTYIYGKDGYRKLLIDKVKEHHQAKKKVLSKYDLSNEIEEKKVLEYGICFNQSYQKAYLSEERTEIEEEHYTYIQIYEDVLKGNFHLIENRQELDDYYSSDLRIEEWDSQKIYRCFHEKGFGDYVIGYIQEKVDGRIEIFNYIKAMLDECNDKQEFLFMLMNIPNMDFEEIKKWSAMQVQLKIGCKE